MKKKLSAAIGMHFTPGIRVLASAAVITSLTACGADTLDSIATDLGNGEEVNLTLSNDDDGNLVIGINDDAGVPADDPVDADGDDAAALYDESVDGEITDDATNPLSLALGGGSNLISGDVIAGDIDYVTVSVPQGYVLSAIELAEYDSVDDLAFIGIQRGTVFTEPPVDTNVANLLGFALFGIDTEGTDLLPGMGSAEGVQGFTAPLEAGDYTFWIQQTGADTVGYTFDLVTSLAASVPAAGSLTVTMTNTSDTQPMTPPVVVLHNAPDADNGMRLFYPSQPAHPSVVAIAENGNNAPMVELLGYLTDQGRASTYAVGFADPANPGPLLPGMSASVDLDLASDDQVLSIVSMVVCTNDGFSGVNAHTLSADASETFMAPIYDAGSETNVLTLDYWVPPCGSEANLTDDENGSVTLHPGQSGSENPDFDFEAGTRYLEVTVTRN
jgi:hypothetical protein